MCNYSEGVERRATARGLAKGLEQGHDEIRELIKFLTERERFDDLIRIAEDEEYCNKLLAEMAEASEITSTTN